MSFYAAFSTLFTNLFVENVPFMQGKHEKKITFYIFQYLFYWIFFYNWRKCSRVPQMLVSQNR